MYQYLDLWVFKSLNHRNNYSNGDIETNPRLPVIDTMKTTAAPYRQSNTAVFDQINLKGKMNLTRVKGLE